MDSPFGGLVVTGVALYLKLFSSQFVLFSTLVTFFYNFFCFVENYFDSNLCIPLTSQFWWTSYKVSIVCFHYYDST